MFLHKMTYLFSAFAFMAFSLVEVYLGADWLGLAMMILALLCCFRLERIERDYHKRRIQARFNQMMERKLRL